MKYSRGMKELKKMEEKIIEILKRNFKNSDIDSARKDLCFLLKIKRSDPPVCIFCKSENLIRLGSWEDRKGDTGNTFECKECDKVFDRSIYN